MSMIRTFYLSRILGNKVYKMDQQKALGKLLDLYVDVTAVRPQVIGVKLKVGSLIRIVDYSTFVISKKNSQYYIECSDLKDKELTSENTLSLLKHVLDKQIVDMFGRKVVRVNDLRLAILANGTYTVAVDVGFEGLLRRLGIAKPIKKMFSPFGIRIPSRLLLWDNIETVDFFQRGITLSSVYTKISTLHPSDLADIIEELDRSTQLALFTSLDDKKAINVLEELETEAQIHVIESLSTEKAASMLEKMPVDEAADILEELTKGNASDILNEMEKEVSDELRELMDYPAKSAGSMMTRAFVSFDKNITAKEAINELKELKSKIDAMYYLYITNHDRKLIAQISLRDLIFAPPEMKLYEIMDRDVIHVSVNVHLDTLTKMIVKYNLFAIPVVDAKMVLLGIVLLKDVLYNLHKSGRRELRKRGSKWR